MDYDPNDIDIKKFSNTKNDSGQSIDLNKIKELEIESLNENGLLGVEYSSKSNNKTE